MGNCMRRGLLNSGWVAPLVSDELDLEKKKKSLPSYILACGGGGISCDRFPLHTEGENEDKH